MHSNRTSRPEESTGLGAFSANLSGASGSAVGIVCGQFPGCGEESIVTRTVGAAHPLASRTVAGVTAPTETSTSTHMQLGSPDCSPLHRIVCSITMCPSITSKCRRRVSFATGYTPSVSRGRRHRMQPSPGTRYIHPRIVFHVS